MQGGYFLGRQPIVDAKRHVVGYELLYRGGADAQHADFGEDYDSASIKVIANAFARFGLKGVLGPHLGLINVTRDMLLSDCVNALPKERVIFEILENAEFDEALVRRCKDLEERGYRLALDDYVVDDPREPYLDLVKLVKLDLPAIDKGELRPLARSLVRAGKIVLAEKVETAEQFETCRKVGCTFFQGYFFARPSTLSARDGGEDRNGLVQILSMTERADTERLAEAVEAQPELSLRLLRIANSAESGGVEPIASLRAVIVRLGRSSLRRWVSILLLADAVGDPAGPRFQNALRGARLLELLSERTRAGCEAGSAFLSGILRSLADAGDTDMEELISGLDLDEVICEGLLQGTGIIGELLLLTGSLTGIGDGPRVDDIEEQLAHLGLTTEILLEEETRAYEWVHEMAAELSGV
ncbi:MAG: EAL domain-containing protein [Myxococcota bacterium]|nr:EAL domain-containing protein [Myxococcota bacterium]